MKNEHKTGKSRWIIDKKIAYFLILSAVVIISGCFEQSNINKNQVESTDINTSQAKPTDKNTSQGVISNANRLYDDYKWKLDLVTEIQKRTDALGTAATKEMYIEWKLRNNEAIEAGERLSTYITEQRNVLDQYWTSDVLVLIAKNKVTFERDNQALEQTINLPEKTSKLYAWSINFYGREGSKDLGMLIFENRGQNLSNVKFNFLFYTANGGFYSSESFSLGDITSGKTVQKKIALPSRYWGDQNWNNEKVLVYINGSVEEIWKYENDEWKEQPLNKTS